MQVQLIPGVLNQLHRDPRLVHHHLRQHNLGVTPDPLTRAVHSQPQGLHHHLQLPQGHQSAIQVPLIPDAHRQRGLHQHLQLNLDATLAQRIQDAHSQLSHRQLSSVAIPDPLTHGALSQLQGHHHLLQLVLLCVIQAALTQGAHNQHELL